MSRLKKSKELKVSKRLARTASRGSGVLLRVDTKFLQTRNLIARRIIGNTPASALASKLPRRSQQDFWPDAGITHQEVTAIGKIESANGVAPAGT
jgi:hypothetical protein